MFQYNGPMNYGTQLIKNQLAERQRVNQNYSLRAFSRDLDVHPGTLSQIIHNKRSIPWNLALKISDRLKLSPKQKFQLLHSIQKENALLNLPKDSFDIELNENYYHVIAEWEHYAILTLMETQSFKSQISWIANRLEISQIRVDVVLNRLEKLGLIEKKRNRWIRTHLNLTTPEDISSNALKVAHKEELQLAEKKLERIALNLRDYSSSTIAMPIKNMNKAKELIRQFRKEFAALVEDNDADEVYLLSIQFFPLTHIENNKESTL